MQALASGSPVYDVKTLAAYVEQDLDLIDQVCPDVVVGDFRLSMAVSAPLRKVRYLALANAYWSPYTAMTRWPIPDLLPTRLFGERLARTLFNRMRPRIFHQHARALNAVRRRYGLSSIGDMLHAYTWGDETLYLDVPQLVPLRLAPRDHHFLGPVIWEPPSVLPEWWDDPSPTRPTLYVTLGSSGQASLLPPLVGELAKQPFNILLATGGRIEPSALPRGVWSADYLPGTRAAARADLVISNGGSPTGYQALSQGVPVLGIASNLDQHLAMHYICEAGAGRLLRSDRVSPAKLLASVREMLTTDRYRVAANRVKQWLQVYDPKERLRERLAFP